MSTTVIYSLIGVDGASPAFQAAGASADKLDSKFGKLGKAATVMSIAIVAAAGVVAVESVKAAVSFQAAMEKIHTQAGASQKSVESLTKSVLKMAPSAQQGPQELAQALYHLKSLGMDNAAAMKALATSSNLAAVGGSNLEDTATAIGAAWRSGIKGGQSFNEVAATVNATIGAGNMTMTDFVDSLSSGILPSARTFGVSLKSVGAALALMTDEGIPANSAATRLRMTLSLMGGPTAAAQKQLAKIGLSGTALATALRGPQGIIGAVQLLKTHLDDSGLSAVQSSALLTAAFGGGKSSSTIMTLINNLGVMKKKQDQINKSMGAYGPAVVAQRKTAAAQFDLLKSAVDTLGIRIGLALLPPVTAFAGYLNTTVIPDVQKVIGWLTSPDVKPWAEIAGKLILAASAATAIYSGLKKAAQLTGLDKILAAAKKPAPSATTTAAANMGTAGDTMYKASLNMLKAAGMSEDATVAGTAGAKQAAAVGSSIGSSLIKGGIMVVIATAIAEGAVKPFLQGKHISVANPQPGQNPNGNWWDNPAHANAISPNPRDQGLSTWAGLGTILKGWAGFGQSAPGIPQAFSPQGHARFAGDTLKPDPNAGELAWTKWWQDFDKTVAHPVENWFTQSLPHAMSRVSGSDWVTSWSPYQKIFTSDLPKAWSIAYEAFQRNLGGRVKDWLTGSLPHLFTGSIPRNVWSPVYQDFQRDVAGKITSWFTVSLPHGVSAAGTAVAKAFGSGFTAGKKWVTGAAGRAEGWIAAPFKKAGTWLYDAGASVIDGLVAGIESKAATPVKAIESVGSGIISKFKSLIKSASPSKVFYQLGTYITTGLALGIMTGASKAENAAKALAAQVTEAFSAGQITSSQKNSLLSRITGRLASDLLSLAKARQTGAYEKFGEQITARIGSGITETIPQAEKAAKALTAAITRALAAGKIGTSQAGQLLLKIQADITSRKDRVVKALKTIGLEMKAGLLSSLADASTAAQAKSAVNKLIGYVKAAWSAGAITTSKASKLTSWLEKDSTKLQALAAKRAKIAATIATAQKYATDTAANVASGAQLTSLQSAAGGTITGQGIVSGLQGQLAAIRRFAADIGKLKAMGLGKALLGQVIDAGPVQGDQLAQAFIASGISGIKQDNALQAEITKTSTALGQTAADVMYDSGAQAGKGFLSGLKAQQASITKLMEQIAKSMVKTLKKELGIKSPSTVTHQIGEFTGIGIEEGLLSRVRHVEGAASRLAIAAVPAPRRGGTPAVQPVTATGGGEFTGNLYLDSGELLGVVRGEITRHDKKLLRAANSGTGLNG